MPGSKPQLGKLATPLTATFPSEIRSATPISAVSFTFKIEPDYIKTPISPPLAYTDFLTKAMALNSPAALSSGETTPDSVPDTASSDRSDCSYKSDRLSPTTSTASIRSKMPSPPATAPVMPPSPYPSSAPMSAPPTGAASFPSLKIPPSPTVSNLDSPLTASTARSPFSARPVPSSVFDWDAALKARFAEKKQKSRTSVRHIREVVTRTVTYTPRMAPAPKGKRRKVE
ncbi:hypothetical protein B0T10DRAFT_107381 [Thelonectria olida]|uniref:Uncharacterized protein n=1 Tax=Thelonectria olida TaxID=1576542 RepID=A0A9P9AVN3_9HYPO|nr:hypothetical protein B0T10DRAFT_107381 [Thelonectria olida]